MPASVPPELRDREVSVRPLIPVMEAAIKKGATPEAMVRGTGVTTAQFQNPRERISWGAFSHFLKNIGSVLSDDELIELGGSALDTPMVRALLMPGRLLFNLVEVYMWFFRADGPASQMFVAHDAVISDLGNGRLRIVIRMKPGYEPSRENNVLLQGSLMAISRAFGAGPAEVKFKSQPQGATYEVRIPQTKGALGLFRRGTSWMFAAKATAEELRRANDELHQRYVEMQREVEARKRAEGELRALNEELEKRVKERTEDLEAANRELASANRELAMFSTSAAHDLRSPLRAINGFATALLEDYGDRLNEDARQQLGRVISGAVRMATLIDALLALSRVSRAEVQREPIDLSEVARAVLDNLNGNESNPRRVDIRIAPNIVVNGDPALVRSLLENLLGNAWKFTRSRREARIELDRVTGDSGGEVYRVSDNGVGFDMNHAEKLFEPFRRLHSDAEFEGTGVGLATVDRIVRRHGGKIWVDAALDRGATFSFTLAPDHSTA
jgi:signal transduction histidine kinase